MEKHHTLLANMYASQILQTDPEMQDDATNMEEMRQKLQQLLWQSSFYDANAVYGKPIKLISATPELRKVCCSVHYVSKRLKDSVRL